MAPERTGGRATSRLTSPAEILAPEAPARRRTGTPSRRSMRIATATSRSTSSSRCSSRAQVARRSAPVRARARLARSRWLLANLSSEFGSESAGGGVSSRKFFEGGWSGKVARGQHKVQTVHAPGCGASTAQRSAPCQGSKSGPVRAQAGDIGEEHRLRTHTCVRGVGKLWLGVERESAQLAPPCVCVCVCRCKCKCEHPC